MNLIFMLAAMIILAVALACLVLMAALVLGEKHLAELEKMSPFECGFAPQENSWQSFSIQFFLVSLVFLVFDVELVLMFPLMVALAKSALLSTMLIFLIFLTVLTLGYLVEWATSQLEWYE